MENDRKTYYIAVESGEISRSETSSTWSFKIMATDEEITELRSLFNQNYANEWKNFIRAHIPFVEYHHDNENNAIDEKLKTIYQAIHRLGDAQAKQHIEEMGILSEDPLA
ncbi:hydrolase [Neobacillus piezotolerans]|uniref:Hydrolase n=1 Tax=Neobacillus piezotolerans TaxID=2259171 RepID=A0A3D8GNR1_9BACI|nr:hydrolase [Neobacillus piezotolerans]RDU36120.1 hydrolase [Neobacillus piezotolerans]